MELYLEIQEYMSLLRNAPLRYRGEEISRIGHALGCIFSNATLSRASKKAKKVKGYHLNTETRKMIADVLRGIIRCEGAERPELLEPLKAKNINLKAENDHTVLIKNKTPLVIAEVVNQIRKGDVPESETSRLISWESSWALERNADRLDAITGTLNWVYGMIDKFIEDFKKKPARKVRLILVSERGAFNRTSIQDDIKTAGYSDRLEIVSLYEKAAFKSLKGTIFPLPFDIAIYHNTHYPEQHDKSIRVGIVNHTPVPGAVDLHKTDKTNYDRLLGEEEVRVIQKWFDMVWEEHGTLKP